MADSGKGIELLEWEFVPADTSKKPKNKSKRPDYTPEDRPGDPYAHPGSKSPLILPLPKNVQKDVILDDTMGSYTIEEKVGETDYRPPSTMTFDEYQRYKTQEMMKGYWKNKHAADTSVHNSDPKSLVPKLKVSGMKNVFGSDYVEIRPTGLVTLDFGSRWQRVYNPNMPIRTQKQPGQFDFDQTITMNVVGKIGDKLKLTTNWDTKAAFEFQNNLKLEYTGYEEDIIQKIEAGNVSLPLNSTLYSGAQNLFGVKAKLQFGRLSATTVLSTQRGKVEEFKVQGGAQSRSFEIRADAYDEYRHFFLSHFFRDNYERSLKSLPLVLSGVKVTRVQVWVTNRINNTSTLKNFVGYTDLGEPDTTDMIPGRNHYKIGIKQAPAGDIAEAADNEANTLYADVKDFRAPDQLTGNLAKLDMIRGTDFEIVNQARQLTAGTDFKFHPDLGYISLTTPLNKEDVLSVAYQYTYQGKTYTVGELTEDAQTIKDNESIILKLIKPQTVKTHLPTWDLMMKNVYQLGATQITRDNFQLKVIYKNDLTGADLPALQEGQRPSGVPLLQLTNLDQLNPNNDRFPDGNFDYVEDVTIDSKNGRIFFPSLEPFGVHLIGPPHGFDPATEQLLINKYVYTELYDSTSSDAKQVAVKDKYYLRGRYQAGSSNEIVLPGINIAPGSVTVLAGSSPLQEGVDYEIDYNLGRLRIKNQGVLQSNKEITIRFEKQDFINFRRKSFIGSRLEYKISKDFFLGGTLLHQTESPNISRVNIGDEPTSNTILGLDGTFKSESRLLTKAIDKLPLIQTKAVSSINISGEGAALLPGYPKLLNKSGNEGGTSYLDDFEGAETPYDLTKTPTKWRLGSTPLRFPEASKISLEYAFGRARLAWYTIDQSFFNNTDNTPSVFKNNPNSDEYKKNNFVRQVIAQEIFKNKDPQQIQAPEQVLDIAYYPTEPGPYNYDSTFGSRQADHKWGSIMREIRNDIDFDNANIQYIEFWMMDPFTHNHYSQFPAGMDSTTWVPVTEGGDLYFNLGSISEDIIKDEKLEFENGLPITPGNNTEVETTIWGRVTTKPFLTNAFDNTPESRPLQDVGLDGLSSADEKLFSYPKTTFQNPNDPSGDDFKHFLDPSYGDLGILERYKYYNGLENNSPVSSNGGYSASNSTLPDNEDLNSDNTVNTLDEYYEYHVKIDPTNLVVGKNHIIDKVHGENVDWFQFRIPIREPESVVGQISGYKSIRWMRMYMTNFKQPIVLRMDQFQLVANQWRVDQVNNLNPAGGTVDPEPTGGKLTVSTMNIEENGATSPDGRKTPYVVPPGFKRDQDVVSQTYRRLNEQSLQLCIDDMEVGTAQGAYKNISFNLINYDRIKMFLHAETRDPHLQQQSGKVSAFLRIGTDNTSNYYEIEVPLKFTPIGNSNTDKEVWPDENLIDIAITDLTGLKGERNKAGVNKLFPYSNPTPRADGKIITVTGNPDLTTVMTIMLGIRNPKDYGRSVSLCIWADELRVTGFNSQAGYATTGRMNLKLADLATVNVSGKLTTVGWGSLDQKVSQRARVNTGEWGVSSNVALDKFIPEKVGLKLPMYVSYDQRIISPKYDPLDPDMLVKNSLANITDSDQRGKYKSYVIDRTSRQSINFTNVQKMRTKKNAKPHLWDVENLALTAAYSHEKRTNVNLIDSSSKYYKGEVVYAFNATPKSIEPFKKAAWMKSRYLKLIKDLNFTPLPSTLSFRSSLDRRITRTQYYQGNPLEGFVQDPFFQKLFTFTRSHGVNWSLTKSLILDYKSNAYSIIDEPNRDPDINKKSYNDSIFSNILRLGRMKNFDQSVGATYKLPLDKFPLTDWINADAKYNAGFTWSSGALGVRDTMGNLISNTQTTGFVGKVNIDKLYNKVKFLKKLNEPPPPKRPTDKDTSKTLPKRELKALKAGVKTLMLLKSINFTFDITRGTIVPGYMKIPKFMGFSGDNGGQATDMFPFIFGSQNANIRDILVKNNWESKSRSLNDPFRQTKSINFTAQTMIEPIKDFKITLNVSRKKTNTYQELFKIDSTGNFGHLSPSMNGGISMTVISIGTAFSGTVKGSGDPNSSATFQTFENYRNAYRSHYHTYKNVDYDTNSQDILIPAFLAAYTKRNPSKTNFSVSPYPKIPLPNWSINFSGLTKISAIKKIFPVFNITHGYTSVYNINNYNSSLLYNQIYSGNAPIISPVNDINTYIPPSIRGQNGQLVPIYIVDQVNIQEAFNPLLGVNFRTNKKLTGDIALKKSRTVTLNLTNAQVQEMLRTDVTIGFGLIRTGVKIPFTNMPPLKNELNAKMNITIGETKTIQRKFDQSATVTAGNLNMQIRPNITYAVNQRVNLMIYFERTINAPKISSAYKNSSTRFGVQVKFTLS